jgi:hypothetical protein
LINAAPGLCQYPPGSADTQSFTADFHGQDDQLGGRAQSGHRAPTALIELASAVIATVGLNDFSSGFVFAILDDAFTLAILLSVKQPLM